MSSHVSDAERDLRIFKKYCEEAHKKINGIGKPEPISNYRYDEFERVKERYRDIPEAARQAMVGEPRTRSFYDPFKGF